MELKTFWCGSCSKHKPMDQLARRKGGNHICTGCAPQRDAAMKLIKQRKQELRKSA